MDAQEGNPTPAIQMTTEASAKAALDLLHDGKVHAICWNATEEHRARDAKMQPDRKIIYMDGAHPFVEADKDQVIIAQTVTDA